MRTELKTWGVFLVTLLFANFFHELGHCIPAWVNGYPYIPTPAKAYSLGIIPATLDNSIAAGGIINSFIFSVTTIIFFNVSSTANRSAILAGALAMPAMYTLRFIISGRGHDGTEFQQAQSIIGCSYNGHAVDWIFVIIFLTGTLIWILKTKPSVKIIGRLLIGAIVTVAFVVLIQYFNNLVFDPLFSK